MLNTLSEHIARNGAEYTALLGLLAFAVVVNMPKPGSPFNWRTMYTWLYDSLQAFISARTPTHPTETRIQTSQQTSTGLTTQDVTIQGTTPVPPTPAEPAQPKP